MLRSLGPCKTSALALPNLRLFTVIIISQFSPATRYTFTPGSNVILPFKFKEELIFSQEELDKATILNKMERINRRSTYGSIKTEAAYLFLQEQAYLAQRQQRDLQL